jgi:hypothetical protein
VNKIIICSIVFLGLVVVLFYPVYAPLSEENLQSMNVPFEQRTGRDFYLAVFQIKDDQWYQCKT